MGDGEFAYKVAVPIDDAVLSLSQFRHGMAVALHVIDHYMPGFFRLVFNGVSAEEAIDECEDWSRRRNGASGQAVANDPGPGGRNPVGPFPCA